MWMLLLSLASAQDSGFPADATDALLAERALEHPVLAEASRWLGTPYVWDGRGTRKNPGMDCLGLLYRSKGSVDRRSWTSYPVNPTPLVKSGLLGRAPQGWAGISRANADLDALQPGDIVYLLAAERPIPDEPLWTETRACTADEVPDPNGLCVTNYWPWHTAMYVDAGVVVHAAPGDVVRTQRLDELPWDALYVTR